MLTFPLPFMELSRIGEDPTNHFSNCSIIGAMTSEGMDDRISNLPIEIIDRILDNMPVRDATRTTILSRKWRNIWPMHPKLVFDQHSLRVKRIDQVINKILLQRMGPIVKFLLDLSCLNSSQYSDIDQWLIFLSRNGLKKLALLYSGTPAKPYRLPSYVFSCPSLKHMALHNVVIKPFSSRSLDNLTFLSFKNVEVESNSSEVFSSLSTPQLKKLSIERCLGIVHLKIVAPLLEVLRIYFSHGVGVNSLLNPNLKEFSYSLGKWKSKKIGFDLLSELFAKLPNIRVLLLDGFFLKMSAADTTPAVLPRTVECLEHLTLDLDFKDFDHISTVICLLQSCPNLQILDLKVSPRIITNDGDRVLNYLKAPKLMKQNLMKLKTMRIYLFKNPVEELILLKLLLAQSPSLDKIIIEEKCHMDAVEGFRIARELLGFSRASPSASIIWNHFKSS